MTSNRAMSDLLEILERDPSLRRELEKAGAQGETQLALAFQGLGKRVGLTIAQRDVQALLGSVQALTGEPSESADDDLANVDLKNLLQKQQQTLQMMSNISKLLHDTGVSVIRKIGG
jgi:hypothetical protein